MATRDKREVRITSLYNFYNLYNKQLITLEVAKANVELNGHILFQSELDDFAEKYPQVDMADFKSFLEQTKGIKASGKKSSGERKTTTRLNTAEAAVERGVIAETHQQYIDLVNAIYENCRQLNLLMSKENNIKARCSFAIPVEHVKEAEKTEELTGQDQAQPTPVE